MVGVISGDLEKRLMKLKRSTDMGVSNHIRAANLRKASDVLMDKSGILSEIVDELLPAQTQQALTDTLRMHNHDSIAWNVMYAEHPARQERLWKENKKDLDTLYSWEFADRSMFIHMHLMQNYANYWKKSISLLRKSPERIELLLEKYAKDDKQLFDLFDSYLNNDIFRKYISNAGHDFFMAIRAMRVKDDFNRAKVNYSPTMRGDIKSKWAYKTSEMDLEFAEGVLTAFVMNKNDELEYDDILKLFRFRGQAFGCKEKTKDELRMTDPSPFIEIEFYTHAPKFMIEALEGKLHALYLGRKQGDRISEYLEMYSKHALAMWQESSTDYEDIVVCRKIERDVTHAFKDLFSVIRGKQDPDMSGVSKRGLPYILETLVDEGILDEKKIIPAINNVNFVTREAALSTTKYKMLAENTQQTIANLPVKNSSGIIEKNISIQKSLPQDTSHVSIQKISSGLEAVLDPGKKYTLVGYGNYTLFFSDVDNLTEFINPVNVYRIALLKEGEDPRQGTPFKIGEKTFFIKGERSLVKSFSNIKNLIDVNDDELITYSFTAITDVPINQFRKEYFKDFLLHLWTHKELIDVETIREKLERFDELDIENYETGVGLMDPVSCRTFSLSGNFAFTLYRRENKVLFKQLINVRQSLEGFLDEIGISYRYLHGDDSTTRSHKGLKLAKREFQKEHLDEIHQALQDDGLLRAVIYADNSEKYVFNGFGKIEICRICNESYIDGNIRRKNDQYNILDGANLHFLARHPKDFYHGVVGNLEAVYDLINESRSFNPHVHLESLKGIENEFLMYSEILNYDIMSASSAFDVWNEINDHVSVFYAEKSLEPEYIAEDIDLQKLYAKQDKADKLREFFYAKKVQAVFRLQEKYECVNNAMSTKREPRELIDFWTIQVLYNNIVNCIGHKALPEIFSDKGNISTANFYLRR